jgi:hypothetical protein
LKKTVRLKIHQDAMRERDKAAMRQPRGDRCEEESIRRLAAFPELLTRRIRATIFFHERGWSAQRLSIFFGWSLEDTVRWLEAGKPLL